MPDIKKRVAVGILGLVLAFGLAACDSEDDPSDTTAPVGSTTSEPVGS